MKKTNNLFKTLITSLLLLTLLISFPFVSIKKVSAQSSLGVDFKSGIHKYILTDPLQDCPNTFECWIKVDKNATGDIGNIFSNEHMASSASIGYEINANGNVCVDWNMYEKYVVFDEYDIRNGQWTHVAVVRNSEKGSFALYINGRLKQEIICGVGADLRVFYIEHAIGGDFYSRQKDKRHFNGSIRQVTIYSRPLSAGEIARDYQNSDAISAEIRSDLIFNGKLTPSSVMVEDNSIYKNHAYLSSNDYFYEDSLFEAKDYTFAVVPDPQMITLFYPQMVNTLPDYILKQENAQKIEAVFTVGDLTNGQHSKGSSFDKQYSTIATQFAKLDGHMPYIFVPGNHDYDDECKTNRNLTYLNKHLKIEKISQWAEWGGSLSPDSIINSYYLLEHAGVKYIVFAMDFGPSDEALEWACNVTEQYLDRRLIMLTHGHLNPSTQLITNHDYGFKNNVSVNSAVEVWDKWLRKYPNVFMTFCGHVISDDIKLKEQVGDHGNVVANFLVNAQGLIMNDGLESLVALFNFDEKNQLVYVNYVSTIQEKLYDFQNQFVYDFNGNTNILSSDYTYTEGQGSNAPSRATTLSTMAKRIGYFSENTIETPNNAGYLWLIALCACVAVGVSAVLVIKKVRGAKNEK